MYNHSLLTSGGGGCWEGLWFKVLVAKYSEEGGHVRGGEGNASTWWMDLNAVREGRGLARGV
ncbi:hypothetical protein A2U01_0048157 [Trifolium medium]|uniref:Uncharacterized protein n=1 Tax=Trifolium medium TaxID=97028 RepID=A0A392QSJ5_9FABA|nr:hypothetical protein [Trifolium medium]